MAERCPASFLASLLRLRLHWRCRLAWCMRRGFGHALLAGLCWSLLSPTSLVPLGTNGTPVAGAIGGAQFKMPDGFRVTLFAGEPDIRKPIAMTLDDRGRLWVIENASYPHWLAEGKAGKDRILIFEDRAGKGHFDSCKVFLDNGTNLSGITVGFGGVWLCATPNLLFIPVKGGRGQTRRAGRGCSRRLGPQRQAQRLQQPRLGTRRLALRLQRHPGHLLGIGKPGTPKTERTPSELRRLALSSDSQDLRGCSPGAPPIPGDWTMTPTARCSSPIA